MWYPLTLHGPRLLIIAGIVLLFAGVVGAVLGLYWSADHGACFASRAGLNNLLTLTPCTETLP